MLTDNELEQYSRHFLLDGWDQACQEKLKNTTAFIAGAGGLGSPVSFYLAAAGIGNIIICDMDSVDTSNLNRQILYTSRDTGSSKARLAADRISALNPNINAGFFTGRVEDAEELISSSDIILDCLDNFDSRLSLNRFAVQKRIPLVHAGVSEYYGQLTFIIPGETPCLNCFISAGAPPSSKGITGAMAGVAGSMQAMEALKYLTGTGEVLAGKLLYIDCKTMRFNTMSLGVNPRCKTCSPDNIKE